MNVDNIMGQVHNQFSNILATASYKSAGQQQPPTNQEAGRKLERVRLLYKEDMKFI